MRWLASNESENCKAKRVEVVGTDVASRTSGQDHRLLVQQRLQAEPEQTRRPPSKYPLRPRGQTCVVSNVQSNYYELSFEVRIIIVKIFLVVFFLYPDPLGGSKANPR